MVVWSEKLYIGSGIKEKKKNTIMKKIENGKPVHDIFCVLIAENDKDLFDIISSQELLFSYYKKRELRIAGLAKGKEAASELVTEMIEEVYKNTGDFKVREYY